MSCGNIADRMLIIALINLFGRNTYSGRFESIRTIVTIWKVLTTTIAHTSGMPNGISRIKSEASEGRHMATMWKSTITSQAP